MARELEDTQFDRHGRIQKTFVVSRRSLSFLDMISSKHNAPRDALVEYSVRRLLPIIANERKKHEKRKELLGEISNHFNKEKLKELGELDSWKRGEFIEKGGWDIMPGQEKAGYLVTRACADGLELLFEK